MSGIYVSILFLSARVVLSCLKCLYLNKRGCLTAHRPCKSDFLMKHFQSLATTHPDPKMPKEKRPISSDDSDSGPEDRAPLPKSQKKSLHKVFQNNQMLNSRKFETLNLEME